MLQGVAGYQVSGVPNAGSPLGERVESTNEWDWRSVVRVEASHVDELAESELVGADQLGVGVGDGGVGGVE